MKVFDSSCLAGELYLITGASSGIGRATARLVAQCGGRVIVSGRNFARLQAVLNELPGNGHDIAQQDLSSMDLVAEWIKSLTQTHGPFSGIFHAAGIELVKPVRMLKQDQLNEVFESSIFSAFGIAKAVAQRGVIREGGSVVYMSSVAGSSGQIGMTAYSAAKAAIDGLVRSLSYELASKKIRVNSVVAAAVKTEMHDRLTRSLDDSALQNYELSHLLGFGEPDDIANAVLFLLSSASKWITGSALTVDGGYLAK